MTFESEKILKFRKWESPCGFWQSEGSILLAGGLPKAGPFVPVLSYFRLVPLSTVHLLRSHLSGNHASHDNHDAMIDFKPHRHT
ncbi:hypothetical protein [uncultured Dialister sp.]|uniref:hypothetical protein n=1 Tax=uncultured Dialister sp. TaxID=278064 RepID=UPI0025E3579F|nr:hypothetical protein [uncultured Dialister sp.]